MGMSVMAFLMLRQRRVMRANRAA